tara:strand:+ start:27477 stop:28802 length:1326 start_codon:yes stop_codon:yes gene_type:complete
MKLTDHMEAFLQREVNLNQHRIDKLEKRVDIITGFIQTSEVFGSSFVKAIPQGSYAQRTIIKPTPKKQEFDADLVVYLDSIWGWKPQDYIEQIYHLFNSSPTYKGKVSRHTRCVKLNYAGEFHIDIVPCVRKGIILRENKICNKATNKYESCSSTEFNKWVNKKNSAVGNNNLLKAIRLSKYLRDYKQNFSVKSILLTTLLAERVTGWEYHWGTDKFKDLPTTLKILFNRLDSWLNKQKSMPIVSNPVAIDDEDFNRHWDERKFQNFKTQVKRYNTWINMAYLERDRAASILKWRRIFGDGFAPKESVTVTQNQTPIPSNFHDMEWPISESIWKLNVEAVLQKEESSSFLGNLSDYTILPKEHVVRFSILDELDRRTKIYWQVVNSGEEAENNSCLRGGFKKGKLIREESTLYKGRHWVEAIAVKQGICIARSGPMVVNIA